MLEATSKVRILYLFQWPVRVVVSTFSKCTQRDIKNVFGPIEVTSLGMLGLTAAQARRTYLSNNKIQVVNVYSFILACLGLNHGSYEPIPSNLAPSSTIGVVRVIVQAANVKKRITRPKPFVTMRVQGRAETRSTAGQTKT